MADFRVLLTGSRTCTHRAAIRAALAETQAAHPGFRMVLVHGMCDPRHPVSRKTIRWAVAEKLSPADQRDLTGADWLADVAAQELGWEIERHPADWRPDGVFDKAAGFRRNALMVSLGASVCLAFVMPCSDRKCRRPGPHGSHGASHCAQLAEAGGIPTRRVEGG
jgi:hypothetical protein